MAGRGTSDALNGREGGRELELSGGREGAEWRGAVGAPSEGGMGGGRMRGRGVTTVKGQRRRRGGGVGMADPRVMLGWRRRERGACDVDSALRSGGGRRHSSSNPRG